MSSPRHTASRFLPKPTFPAAPPPPASCSAPRGAGRAVPQFPIPTWLCGLSLPAPPPRCPHRPQPILAGRVGAALNAPALPVGSPHHSLALSPMLSAPPSPSNTSGLSPVFQEKKSIKEKQFFHFGAPQTLSPSSPLPPPTFALFLPPLFLPFLWDPAPLSRSSHTPSRLPLSLLVLPFPPGGGVGPIVSMGMEAAVAGKAQRQGGGWGEGEGAAGTWHKEPCGLGGHRHPSSATPLLALIRDSGLVLLSFWSNSNGPYWKRKEKVVKSNQKYVAVPALLLHTYTRGWGG